MSIAAGDDLTQSAPLSSDLASKPHVDNMIVRRRQSFKFGDNRLGPLAPSEGSGQMPDTPAAASANALVAPGLAALLGTQQKDDHTQASAMASAPQPVLKATPSLPHSALKAPQSAQKRDLKAAVVHKKSAAADSRFSSGPVPKPSSKASAATNLPSRPSLQKAQHGAQAAHLPRQGSSLAQLVETYKSNSAARKQTGDGVSALVAGRQQAAFGTVAEASSRSLPFVHNQVLANASAPKPNSSRRSPVQAKDVVTPKAPKTAHSVGHLQPDGTK